MQNKRTLVSNDIVSTNENILIVKNSIDQILDSLDVVKGSIQQNFKTLFIDEPIKIEFIVESKSWDGYFNSLIYEITINNKKEMLKKLYTAESYNDSNQILKKQSV